MSRAQALPEHARARSHTTNSSSPILVHYPARRRLSDHEEDWEDLASELHPSDSASHTKSHTRPTQRQRAPSTRQDRRKDTDHIPPVAPSARLPIYEDRRPRRSSRESAGARSYEEERPYLRRNSRDSRRSAHREPSARIDYHRDNNDYYDDDMYDRRGPQRPRYQDRHSYDDYDRNRGYSPPQSSYVTRYEPYPPDTRMIQHYAPPQYGYPPQYPPQIYPMPPPHTAISGSANGYFHHPPLPYHYQRSSSSRRGESSTRTDEEPEHVKRMHEALQKQEDHLKQMREQMAADVADRQARDDLREVEIRQKEEAHAAMLAEAARRRQIAEEIAAAEKAAKERAEAEAAEKAEKADKKAREEREKQQKEIEALKRANKEAEAWKPEPDDKQAPIKFKDAAGRTWVFPYKYCRRWETFRVLVIKCYMDNPAVLQHVEKGNYWLFGPDDQALMPDLWSDTVKGGWEIRQELYPPPPQKPKEPAPPPPPPALAHRSSHREKDKQRPPNARFQSSAHIIDEGAKSRSKKHEDAPPPPPPPPPPPQMHHTGEAADDIVEIVTEPMPKARKKASSSAKEADLGFMARWMVGTAGGGRRRRS